MRQDEARHNVRPALVLVHLPSFLPYSVFVGLISSLVGSPNFDFHDGETSNSGSDGEFC